MQDFIFNLPTKIIFGKDKVSEIGKHIKKFGPKVFMLYGEGSIKNIGVYDIVIDSLKKEGLDVIEYSGVKSNPVLSHTNKGIKVAKEKRVNCILGVGGGSVIDEAKAIATGFYYKGNVWDFYKGKRNVNKALPIVSVLTIPATSSEVNGGTVLTNEETRQKFGFFNQHLIPQVSILDPKVTFSIPAEYTAYSAVDVISHMLEGYLTNEADLVPVQDRIIEVLIKTVMESTEIILKDPKNYQERAIFMWSASLANSGIPSAGLGNWSAPNHMFGHVLGGYYDIPHGASLSIIIPAWMKYNLEEKTEKFAKLARNVFGVNKKDEKENAKVAVQEFKKWFKKIGAPVSFGDAELPTNELDDLAEGVMEVAKIWGIKGYSRNVILKILKLAL